MTTLDITLPYLPQVNLNDKIIISRDAKSFLFLSFDNKNFSIYSYKSAVPTLDYHFNVLDLTGTTFYVGIRGDVAVVDKADTATAHTIYFIASNDFFYSFQLANPVSGSPAVECTQFVTSENKKYGIATVVYQTNDGTFKAEFRASNYFRGDQNDSLGLSFNVYGLKDFSLSGDGVLAIYRTGFSTDNVGGTCQACVVNSTQVTFTVILTYIESTTGKIDYKSYSLNLNVGTEISAVRFLDEDNPNPGEYKLLVASSCGVQVFLLTLSSDHTLLTAVSNIFALGPIAGVTQDTRMAYGSSNAVQIMSNTGFAYNWSSYVPSDRLGCSKGFSVTSASQAAQDYTQSGTFTNGSANDITPQTNAIPFLFYQLKNFNEDATVVYTQVVQDKSAPTNVRFSLVYLQIS